MSPVSRGRKPKKSKSSRKSRPALPLGLRSDDAAVRSISPLAALERLVGPPVRPEWFDRAIKTVLDGAEALASAPGPRALEQLTAELLGAELYLAVQRSQTDSGSTGGSRSW
jgi:hypothetical protein